MAGYVKEESLQGVAAGDEEIRQSGADTESQDEKRDVIAADALYEEDGHKIPDPEKKTDPETAFSSLQEMPYEISAGDKEEAASDGGAPGTEEQLRSAVEAYFSGDASSEDVCGIMNQAFAEEGADSGEVYRVFGSAAGECLRGDNLEAAGDLLAYTAFGIEDASPFLGHLDRLEAALFDSLPPSAPENAMDAVHERIEAVFSDNVPHVLEMDVMGVMIETDGQKTEIYDGLSGEPYCGSDLEALQKDFPDTGAMMEAGDISSDSRMEGEMDSADPADTARVDRDEILPASAPPVSDDGADDPADGDGIKEPYPTESLTAAVDGENLFPEEESGSRVFFEGYGDPEAVELQQPDDAAS